MEKAAQEPRGSFLTSAGTHYAGEEAKIFRSNIYGRLLIKQFKGSIKALKLKVIVILALGCCVTLYKLPAPLLTLDFSYWDVQDGIRYLHTIFVSKILYFSRGACNFLTQDFACSVRDLNQSPWNPLCAIKHCTIMFQFH